VAVSKSEMKVTLDGENGMPLSDVPALDVPEMALPRASGELFTRALSPSG
jgi:hypothetical protein